MIRQLPTRANTLGYLLAGGRATRMGGCNKALVPWKGTAMGQYVVRQLQKQCHAVWASANRDFSAIGALGVQKVLPDIYPGFAGPLAALDALADQAPACEWVLTAPCDVPGLPENLLPLLARAAQNADVPIFTIEAGGRTHNTIALIHTSVLPGIRSFLQRGDRKVGLWMHEQGCQSVVWDGDERAFANVNTAEELQALEK